MQNNCIRRAVVSKILLLQHDVHSYIHWRVYHWATLAIPPPPSGRRRRAKRGAKFRRPKCSKSKVSHTAIQSCRLELMISQNWLYREVFSLTIFVCPCWFYCGLTARVWPPWIIFFGFIILQLNTVVRYSTSRVNGNWFCQ